MFLLSKAVDHFEENAQSMGHDVSDNLNDLIVILDMSSREEVKVLSDILKSLTAGSERPLGRVESVWAATEGRVVARRHGLRLAPPLESRQILHCDRLNMKCTRGNVEGSRQRLLIIVLHTIRVGDSSLVGTVPGSGVGSGLSGLRGRNGLLAKYPSILVVLGTVGVV